MKKKNIFIALGVVAVYFLLYLIGRIVWCDIGEGSSFVGWLWTSKPFGKRSYLYGWLLSSNLYWLALILSALPALWGKWQFSITTTAGFIVGIIAGMIWGPNPAGAEMGQSDFGWAIWGIIFLLTIVGGIILERHIKKSDCKPTA